MSCLFPFLGYALHKKVIDVTTLRPNAHTHLYMLHFWNQKFSFHTYMILLLRSRFKKRSKIGWVWKSHKHWRSKGAPITPHIIILWKLLWVMCYHLTTVVVNHQIDSLHMWKKEDPSIPLPIMCLLKDYLNLSMPFLTLYPHVTFPALLRKPYLIVIGPRLLKKKWRLCRKIKYGQ